MRAQDTHASYGASPDHPRGDAEARIVLDGISWRQYESLLAELGDHAGVRLAYLSGALEIMSPSTTHETWKKNFARLLELCFLELELPLVGYGSTTFRKKAKKRGVEPDECYVVGEKPLRGRELSAPDLAIEVVVSSWAIDKFSLYAGLGVKELWLLREKAIEVHVLRGAGYRRARKSRLLPDVDLGLVLRYVFREDQFTALKEYRAALRRSTRR